MNYLYLFFTFFLFSSISAKEVDISEMEISLSAECEPLVTVADCVNVLSGHFFQVELDLVGNTIDPLYIERTYDSGGTIETFMGFSFGSQFPLIASKTQKGARHSHAMISERDGFLIPYRGKSSHHVHECEIDPRLFEKGYTNLNTVEHLGHSNLINWHATYKPQEGRFWKVTLGNGANRVYGLSCKLSSENRKRMGVPTKNIYLLTEETKPNGNKIRFDYAFINEKPRLNKIQTVNRKEQILNEFSLEYTPTECLVKSSCGSHVLYVYEEQSFPLSYTKRNILLHAYSSQNDPLYYDYILAPVLDHKWVKKVGNKNGRFTEVKYEKDKVVSLQEPVGPQGESVTTYYFQYEKSLTKVNDAHGQLTEYHFDKKQRLSEKHYFENNRSIRQDFFEWNPTGWLQKKSIWQGSKLYLATAYQYDGKGNVISKIVSDYAHSYETKYTYSSDDRHLLLSKTTPTGLLITYEYLPETHLCTKEFYHYQGKIQERTFRFYDDNGQLQGIVEDDGSGQDHTDLTDVTYVKEKFIYTCADNTPAFGKPSRVFEKYLDPSTGKMVEQNRTDFYYDEQGNVKSEKVYDRHGNFCYDINKSYDERLRVTFKSDPHGHATLYKYHGNNKVSVEENHSLGTSIFYDYDKANRLIRKEERHKEDSFVTQYRYNALSQLISEIDPYGHETNFEYDRFGHLTKTIYPAIEVNGALTRPVFSSEYNILGHCISKTDENGHKTCYKYTLFGEPTEIVYPDGSIERYLYSSSGQLERKWATDGSSIGYTRDAKGRVLHQTWYDQKGSILKQEEYRYKGDLLVYKKDSMGIETFYQYDGAGRKIEEKTLNQIIYYTYDDLNRLIKTSKQDQHELLEYDWKDQITSKTLVDSNDNLYAKTLYDYDVTGNLTQKTIQYSSDRSAIYQWEYHTDGSLLSSRDPLGNKSTKHYNHHHYNGWNQQVQCRALRDPLQREIREADDPLYRINRRDIYEGSQPVSITHYYYDAIGQLVKESTRVMDQGVDIREYAVQFVYNNRGQLISEIEHPHGKVTKYEYDNKNRLTLKIKPDQVSLCYVYDSLDRLNKFFSSDLSISYEYTYDLHSNPIEIRDLVNHTVQKRCYDSFDRLIEEELTPGNTLHYQYDNLGRITQITLPDSSTILYEYGPFHLRTIKRPSYSIHCQEYDQTGHLLKFETPAGHITYDYDLLGRVVSIKSPSWQSHQDRFDPVGNLLTLRQIDPDGEHLEHFSYDRFNHLTQEKASQYRYDSLGNCIEKNSIPQKINDLNQLVHDGDISYTYDANGNLLSSQNCTYQYDALNRLINCEQDGKTTTFLYDAFNRCLQITDSEGTKQLLYQYSQEIGSLQNGKLQEFRLIHPEQEMTFAIEQDAQVFFPVQDQRFNICGLYTPDGKLSQWSRYTAFGNKITFGTSIPWGFANRREVCNLSLFTDRLYNPHIMRWLTTDPVHALNLYTYNYNNPFRYTDPHGQLVFAIPLFIVSFSAIESLLIGGSAVGLAAATIYFSPQTILAACGIGGVAYLIESKANKFENRYNQIQTEEKEEEKEVLEQDNLKGRRAGKDNKSRGGPPRDDKTKNYLPDPAAEGSAHTTLGTRTGKDGKSYTQGATFEENKFRGRTDVTNHGRSDHPNPHFHEATGPDSAKGIALPIN